jgi:hypothetical protein
MNIFRRALATASVTGLLMGSALAGTAQAQGAGQSQGKGPGQGVTLACGTTVTHSVKLGADIGPCMTTDGLIVTGSNITVNLNGHTITGSHQNCPGSACAAYTGGEQVGIFLEGASGDTVMNGTVAYFDGGVVVEGGAGNTVRGIDAHDNINSNVLTNIALSAQNDCFYGDGIAVFSSNNNSILDNTAVHNGPYDGIAVVGIMVSGKFGPADNNLIQNNTSMNNYVADQTTSGGGTQCGGSKNAIYSGMGQGRQVQDMGIRIEGPGAAYNTVKENQVANNGLEGIAVFDYFCNLNDVMKNGVAGHEPPNHNNTIADNTVSGTGNATVQAASGQVDPSANGIAILSEGNPGVNCTAYDNTIAHNTSVGNFQDGIFVGGMPSAPGHPQDTTVVNNVVNDNTVDGLGVQSGAVGNVLTGNAGHGNGEFDGADYNFNPSCGTDTWNRNRFTTVNQPCVANGGTGTVQKVVFDGANGIATGLQTTWSGLVTVTNPAGITIYGGADSTCSTPIATGTTPVSGNGTSSPTVSLTTLPPPGNAYFEIAANSVSAGPGVGNAAVPCTGVTFSGTPTVDTVSSVSITGTIAAPVFTVTGTGFGSTPPPPNPSTPPDGQQGCPTSPNSSPQGFLYGTDLYVVDNGPAGFDAGINSVTGEFDCVGLVIQSWSPTQVVFTMGNLYDQNIPGNDYVLANGDPVQVAVLGAVGNTTVSLPS